LIERIHGKIDRVAEKLPTHLVVRDSTALAASVQATEHQPRARAN
jgi:hypothetical protein